MKGMAMRRNQQCSKQNRAENHDPLIKIRQSCDTQPTTQRKALIEIGNVVRQQNVRASICVEILKENAKTASKPQLRRSTRLSVFQAPVSLPKKATRVTAKPKETPVTYEKTAGNLPSKVKVMGPRAAVPAILESSLSSTGHKKRKTGVAATRAPRLTMKPPPVETPPEEREAAQNLIRQSLAAERNRRFTMAVTSEIQQVQVIQNTGKAVRKPNTQKRVAHENPGRVDNNQAHRRCYWLVSTYSKQVYAYLHRLDRSMTSKMAQEQQSLIKETTRTKLVEWMALAYVRLNLLQETFQLSVSILDRYLLRMKDTKETRFELVAVTCISLAIKYEELLTTLVRELLSLSSRPYTMKEYVAMEAHVVKELGFQIARPIPLEFLRRYNTAAKCDRTQHSIGKYFTDLAQLESSLTRLPASSIAAAAAFIGMTLRVRRCDPDAWSPVMVHYSALTFEEIKPVVSQMAMLALPGGQQCQPLKRIYTAETSYVSADRAQNLLLALHDMSFSRAAIIATPEDNS